MKIALGLQKVVDLLKEDVEDHKDELFSFFFFFTSLGADQV